MQLLLSDYIRMQEIMVRHILKNAFSWPILTKDFSQFVTGVMLSLVMIHREVDNDLLGKNFCFADVALRCNTVGN